MALLSQVLHHVEDPEIALREAVRIVRPRGRVVVMELKPHTQEWVRDRFGDRWLGFDTDTLTASMRRAGLSGVVAGSGLDEEPFGVVVAAGTRKARS